MSAFPWPLGRNTRAQTGTMSVAADASQDRIVACNGKDDVPVIAQPTTRRGLRIYKIVVLGDGGVGKSGISCPIQCIVTFRPVWIIIM